MRQRSQFKIKKKKVANLSCRSIMQYYGTNIWLNEVDRMAPNSWRSFCPFWYMCIQWSIIIYLFIYYRIDFKFKYAYCIPHTIYHVIQSKHKSNLQVQWMRNLIYPDTVNTMHSLTNWFLQMFMFERNAAFFSRNTFAFSRP